MLCTTLHCMLFDPPYLCVHVFLSLHHFYNGILTGLPGSLHGREVTFFTSVQYFVVISLLLVQLRYLKAIQSGRHHQFYLGCLICFQTVHKLELCESFKFWVTHLLVKKKKECDVMYLLYFSFWTSMYHIKLHSYSSCNYKCATLDQWCRLQ